MNFRKLLNSLDDFGHSLDKKVSKTEDKIVLKQSPVWMKSVTWALMGTSVAGMLFLTFGKTEEVVTVKGKLEPIGEVKNIQIPEGGVADKILVEPGQRVKAGQILIRLESEVSADKLASAKENLKDKRIQLEEKTQQLEFKQKEREQTKRLTASESNMARTDYALQSKILSGYNYLVEQGAISRVMYWDQRNKVTQLQNQLENIKLIGEKEVIQQEQDIRELNSVIAGIRGEIAELVSKNTEAESSFSRKEIRSPVDGVVFDLKPTTIGFVASSGEPVMKIVPHGQLEADVEIPSNKIGFVSIGQKTDVSIDSFPSSDFGVLSGSLKRIGSDALPPDASTGRKGYRYPAVVKLDSQSLNLKNGRNLPLQVGMSVTANIKLRTVSYLQLLLGAFNDKADSIRQL